MNTIVEKDYERVFIDPKSGGRIFRHKLVDHNLDDYKEVWEVAVDKAKIGSIVHILPKLEGNHPDRDTVFQGSKPLKNPDIKVNGEYTEISTPVDVLHDNKIGNCIRHSQKQADHLIIRLLSDYNVLRLGTIARGRFMLHPALKSIEFKLSGEYHSFYRKQFGL